MFPCIPLTNTLTEREWLLPFLIVEKFRCWIHGQLPLKMWTIPKDCSNKTWSQITVKKQRWHYFFLPVGETTCRSDNFYALKFWAKKCSLGDDAPIIITRIMGTFSLQWLPSMLNFNQCTFKQSGETSHLLPTYQLGHPIYTYFI